MIVFDIETLGTRSTSVILSMAAVYFNPDEKPDHIKLRETAFFAKFDVDEQVRELKREVDRDTITWWSKQCLNAQVNSFKRNPAVDVPFRVGHAAMKAWADEKKDPACWVWARGSLDQVLLDDITKQCGLEPIFTYNRWRDVRTAVDCLFGTTNGYTSVEVPPRVTPFDPALHITKHRPVDDCIFDAMQLLYGKGATQ